MFVSVSSAVRTAYGKAETRKESTKRKNRVVCKGFNLVCKLSTELIQGEELRPLITIEVF